ncbi:MAG TPA: ABC transporter substrate-binding protein [Firmicutes bacterium]|nr:ABC transporter substrate-binding protein [Bacillota bacterium]
MSKKTFLLILPAFFLLFGCGLALSGPELQEVTLAMTYIPNVQFAPWYVAEVKGFFQEEGIKVDFDYRMDIDALQLVGAGHLDFAVAGGDQVITARSQGIPVTYLLSLFTKFPPSVVALEEAGIKKPQDLQGKKIGLPLYGTSLLATKAILRAGGVKESAVELVDIGYTQIASLTQGRVDAVVVFTNNEPQKLRAEGYKITEIPSWEYFSLVGHGLITGEKQISLAPQKVGAMIRATRKGMQYTLAHPEEAFEITLSYLPELGKKQAALEKQVFLASLELWENKYTIRRGLGYSDPRAWLDSQQLMLEMGFIKRETPIDKLLNQSFLGE